LNLPGSQTQQGYNIAIRLNRPKGIHVVKDLLGKDLYAEIIDLNDKPTIAERWTELRLVEQLFLELASTKLLVSHDSNCGVTVYKYERFVCHTIGCLL
jgi:hypothetical protein